MKKIFIMYHIMIRNMIFCLPKAILFGFLLLIVKQFDTQILQLINIFPSYFISIHIAYLFQACNQTKSRKKKLEYVCFVIRYDSMIIVCICSISKRKHADKKIKSRCEFMTCLKQKSPYTSKQ